MRFTSVLILLVVLAGAGDTRAEAPATFGQELSHLRRLMACDERVQALVTPPEGLSMRTVDRSCKRVHRQIERFRKRWLDKAQPFLAEIVPDDISKTIVYPFGGADLLTALVTFPDLSSVTTMSLEWVGDPRAILTLESSELRKNLTQQHAFLIKLFQVNHNRTIDLQELNRSPIPAPLVFALTALDLLGYEPLEARWFQLADDGSVQYLTPNEIQAFDQGPDGRKQMGLNAFFGNVELTFRKADDPAAPVQVWRHIRANLHDDHLPGSPTMAYLEGLGPITGMTKAASYLIWRDDFSAIRNYLLDNMSWMISDTTGITPYHAGEKGFVQDTWGTFQGNMFAGAKKGEQAMIELWRENPNRKVPFQYGYPDKNEHDHLLVTRKPD